MGKQRKLASARPESVFNKLKGKLKRSFNSFHKNKKTPGSDTGHAAGKTKYIYNPSIIIAEGMVERLRSAGLEAFLLKDYWSVGSLSRRDMLDSQRLFEKLNVLMRSILAYLDLPDVISLKLEETNEKDEKGRFVSGSYHSSQYRKEIVINRRYSDDPDTLMATLCHECTHFFMEYHHLKTSDEDINEKRTDIMAMLIGFHEQIIKGYQVKAFTTRMQNLEYTKTIQYGYISAKDCEYVERFLLAVRANIAHETVEKDRLKAEKKMALEHLQGVKALYEQLMYLDFRRINASADSLEQIQIALLEYESRNIGAEIATIEKDVNNVMRVAEITSVKNRIQALGEDLLRWSSVFQGTPG